MAIRFAILGLLAEGPLHGYAVHALFEERLGDFWELNYGQVYQVLTALERQGFVRASESRIGRRPLRKVYAITAAGRDALVRWLREARVRSRPFRDDFYIRLYFAAATCPDQVERLVNDQLVAVRADALALEARRRALPPPGARGDLVRRLFVEAAILHAGAAARALEAGRDVVQAELAFEPRAGSGADAVAEVPSPDVRRRRRR